MYKTREEVESWLKNFKIENYIINEDLTVDVDGDVNLSSKKLSAIPIKFGIVNGNFYCHNNILSNLKGCPKIIKKDFNCGYNKLTSFEGCPEIVGFCFHFHSGTCKNSVSFEYLPLKIEGPYMEIIGTFIKEDELVNFNCDITNVHNIFSDFSKNGNKEEFLEKVNYYKNKKENELLKELIVNNNNNVKLNKKL